MRNDLSWFHVNFKSYCCLIAIYSNGFFSMMMNCFLFSRSCAEQSYMYIGINASSPLYDDRDPVVSLFAQHMSCAGANMVHCPGYADDLRQYTTLNMDTRAKRGFPALWQKVRLRGNRQREYHESTWEGNQGDLHRQGQKQVLLGKDTIGFPALWQKVQLRGNWQREYHGGTREGNLGGIVKRRA